MAAVALLTGAALVAGCSGQPSGSPSPSTTPSPSPVTPSVRDVLTRDVDHPPRLDCQHWRYGPVDPATLPKDFEQDNYRFLSSRADGAQTSQQDLCGQRGAATDLAFSVEQGRDDVLIAVLDSGIEWRAPGEMAQLATKAYLNQGELSKPLGATAYDANGDGVFDVSDYSSDTRVTDRNRNGLLDPEDLILDPVFSNGVDDDGNGYVDDISGWDFLWGDNNPNDDVMYGHGTGEARDSTAVDGNGDGVGTCPRCRFLPVRVGDSFIAEGGRFAAGVLFGLDAGADVIQEALGAINNPPQSQAAVDAAYARGVPVVASMADEASKHPNLPAAQNHTIPVNSVTVELGPLADVAQQVGGQTSFLALNGCTNYGGIAWVSVPSNSCSSEATGLGAGIVGLVESAARTAGVQPYPDGRARRSSDNVLSANEVAQLMRSTADDVDFSSPGTGPEDRPNRTGDTALLKYPTTPGWDATFGFGRLNSYELVRAVAAKEIPPEADLTGPSWFDVLPTSGSLPVVGTVAAVRSSSYSYKVQWTTGLQPAAYPAKENWRTISAGTSQTAPRSGTLAQLDLATVAAALPDGGKGASATGGRPDEDRFAVRVRVVVTDAEGRTGVSQKQVFVHDDPALATYRRIPGAGTASPVFADLNKDGKDELVLGTDDGYVHAFTATGSEVPGWPVRTQLAGWWNQGSPAATAAGIPPLRDGIGVGAPVVADLDGDGAVEVAVADDGGYVSLWRADGTLRSRMSVDPRFSTQSATNKQNRSKRGFLASVAAGDLDGDGKMELVGAAMDRHVYAWRLDGSTVPGFPVLLVDPVRTSAVDPTTHQVTFNGAPKDQLDGGELIVTPAVGDLTGDGKAEIVVGAQEQYKDEPGAVFPGLFVPGLSANTRVYAVWNDGTNHPATTDRFPAHPADQAYLPGWPAPLAMVIAGVLPTIGNGVNVQAAIGPVDSDPAPEVVIASSAGPVYVLDADGTPPWYKPFGWRLALDWIGEPFGANANSTDGGIVVAAFGGPAIGNLTNDGKVSVTAPTVGLKQAADQLLPGDQGGDTQLMAWSGWYHRPLPGFPHQTRDLGFFVTPGIADVDADGRNEVVAGHGVSLLDAVNADGVDAPGWPKLTGGWVVGTPGLGDRDGNGTAEISVVRRDGVLQVWNLPTATSKLTEWPRFGHDGRNSGDLRTKPR